MIKKKEIEIIEIFIDRWGEKEREDANKVNTREELRNQEKRKKETEREIEEREIVRESER